MAKEIRTIKVLQGDINDGEKGSCSQCPVALAVARTFGYRFMVKVDWLKIKLTDTRDDKLVQRIQSPRSVSKFVNDFDNRDNHNPVEPFEFELEVEI